MELTRLAVVLEKVGVYGPVYQEGFDQGFVDVRLEMPLQTKLRKALGDVPSGDWFPFGRQFEGRSERLDGRNLVLQHCELVLRSLLKLQPQLRKVDVPLLAPHQSEHLSGV